MHDLIPFISHHGVTVVFLAVLIDQIGIPFPAIPWLLVAGALARTGQLDGRVALAAATTGSLIPDLIWFLLGRSYGTRVLGFLCRLTLEPDSCSRRMQHLFDRFGMRGLVVAKFIPGLSTLAPPLAGSAGVGVPLFIASDLLSSVLYGGVYLGIGYAFSQQLDRIMQILAGLGNGALILIVSAVALYLGYKYHLRRRFLRQHRMARISVDELHDLQEVGGNPMILDLRAPFEFTRDPTLIRGAIHMTPDEVEHRHLEIPRDRDVIVYCSCPNEVTSAKIALFLHRKGITRVRPLLGGIDAWRDRRYPLGILDGNAAGRAGA